MFDRLIGMETEYALRYHRPSPDDARESNANLFKRLLEYLQAKLPTAPSLTTEGFGPHTWFMSNGGAVRFERILYFGFLPEVGLVEGMTPECRTPRQLLVHQRAQDVLLSQAASSATKDGEATLLKNNCDAHGNFYGNHENYEATVATGLRLFFWRLGVVLLLPTLFLLAVLIELLLWIGIAVVYAFAFLVCRLLLRTSAIPVWEVASNYLLHVVMFPVRLIAGTFVRLTAFRPQRQRLLAFLVSRPIITGAGSLDEKGQFHLSARARAIGSVCGVVQKRCRPIFLFNHVLNDLVRPMLGDRFAYARLFRARQRLQISAADSNMTQTAEYLKIGITLLVLDAIEANALEDAPRLKRPVRAVHAICADPSLQATVPLMNGEEWTALQIQRFYLQACRNFVQGSWAVPPEAHDILRLWQETLDTLERDPNELVGKLDWVTKRYLLEQAGNDLPLEAQRKIDIRYHELSQSGYYLQMEAAGVAPTIVDPEEVLQATMTPPQGTPAALRGETIRTEAPSGIRASWSTAVIGTGWRPRIVRFK